MSEGSTRLTNTSEALLLELKDVCKSYYGDDGGIIKANDNVNFSLAPGEVHALLGENGAGKSTLVRNLSRRPDSGEIFIDGSKVYIDNPIDSKNLGIGIAYQDLSKSLVERHSIVENILGIVNSQLISMSKLEKQIKDTFERYNLDLIDPKFKIWKLSGGEKQRVEILKAIISNPRILILDEPTSMLTPGETKKLFSLIKSFKAEGKSVILITHHLEEAIEFCDKITVMRLGQVVDVLDEERVNSLKANMGEGIKELANLMVGKDVLYDVKKSNTAISDPNTLLNIFDLSVSNDMGDRVVHDVNLSIQEGEILGIAGITGNGQKELVEAILNIRKRESGSVVLRDLDTNSLSTKQIRSLGLAYIPEDRDKGMISELSIRENMMLNTYSNSNGLLIELDQLIQETDALIREYSVKTQSPLAPMSSLSGGNKQKVVVARELTIPYENGNLIIIAENPTIGLDVQTTQFVRQKLLEKRDSGAGVLLVSSDLNEILSLSDNVAVIYHGKILDILPAEMATREKVGLLMGGVTNGKSKKEEV